MTKHLIQEVHNTYEANKIISGKDSHLLLSNDTEIRMSWNTTTSPPNRRRRQQRETQARLRASNESKGNSENPKTKENVGEDLLCPFFIRTFVYTSITFSKVFVFFSSKRKKCD